MDSALTKCGAVEGDRLSRLPDDILYSILLGLPLKDVVRTSGASQRFKKMWLDTLATSPVLDLTDGDFVISGNNQTLAQAAAIVERCLSHHTKMGAPLHVSRVAMDCGLSGVTAFAQDIARWIMFAAARGAKEVEVNLMPVKREGAEAQLEVEDDGNETLFVVLPGNSLVRLALDRFSLRAVPPDAAGLNGLRSLSISHSNLTHEGVQTVLSSCHSLESLSLRRCHLLASLEFLLKRAPVLEELVLVTADEGGLGDEQLEIIRRLVSAVTKASPEVLPRGVATDQARLDRWTLVSFLGKPEAGF